MNMMNPQHRDHSMECLLHYYHHYYYYYYYFNCLFFFFSLMMISLPQFAATSSSTLLPFNSNTLIKNHTCLHDQSLALLQFRASFDIYFSATDHSKVVSWNANTDCCSSWGGISCNNKGYVIGLDVSSSGLGGSLYSNSSLFQLHRLTSLNLAGNDIHFYSIPHTFSRLISLTYLDLSDCSFFGQAPVAGISQLITTVISNISSLTELHMNHAYSSPKCLAADWCKAISSSQLHDLQVLSFSDSRLLGPFDSTCLLNLPSLLHLDLSYNEITQFPRKFLFHLPNLLTLDLSVNAKQTGFFLEFPQQSILQQLSIKHTNFSGTIPESIGNLKLLTELSLHDCQLLGSVPASVSNLSHLVILDMSLNNFTGLLPSLNSFSKTSITIMDLSFNQFTGSIPASYVDGLPNLQILDLSNNFLTGTIPFSLFTLPSLKTLLLNENRFNGELQEFILSQAPSLSQLSTIDLRENMLEGRIPTSFSQLSSLEVFILSSNKFYGVMDPSIFDNKRHLTVIDLSYNGLLSIDASDIVLTIPNLFRFSFSSCNLTEFPRFLKHQEQLIQIIDLSNNQLHGLIPVWIWNKSGNLNLSHNSIVNFEKPNIPVDILSSSQLEVLDLRSNMLKGPIPTLPTTLFSVLLANNNLVDVPMSICRASNLQILDLSNNQISGSIPPCLGNFSELRILDLSKNKICGSIPQSFGNLSNAKELNFNKNLLEGPLSSSLADCERLEILDLGNNRINDTFPSWLESLKELQVLILQSNKFYGPITRDIDPKQINRSSFPLLHIIDISSNNFTGHLPLDYFRSSKVMTSITEGGPNQLVSTYLPVPYYRYALIIANKGGELTYGYKLLYIFNVLDLSSNNFEGMIPESIGDFKSIAVLNLSHNHLVGKIPLSLGNLTELQSLDLSSNDLSGEIPSELAKLTFLSVFDVSWNQLVGRIPTGAQFNTYSSSSFEGNLGLCGSPLQTECNHHHQGSSGEHHYSHENSETNFVWIFALAGFASGIVVGVVVEHFILPKNMRYLSMILKIETFILSKMSQRRIRH